MTITIRNRPMLHQPRHLAADFRQSTVVQSSGTPHNEKQTITFAAARYAGSFAIVFSGQTTGSIAYNDAAAAIIGDLEALSNIGTGNISVVDTSSVVLTLEWIGTLANTNVPQVTVDTSSLKKAAGILTLAQTQNGGDPLSPATCVLTASAIPNFGTFVFDGQTCGPSDAIGTVNWQCGGLGIASTPISMTYTSNGSGKIAPVVDDTLAYTNVNHVTCTLSNFVDGANIVPGSPATFTLTPSAPSDGGTYDFAELTGIGYTSGIDSADWTSNIGCDSGAPITVTSKRNDSTQTVPSYSGANLTIAGTPGLVTLSDSGFTAGVNDTPATAATFTLTPDAPAGRGSLTIGGESVAFDGTSTTSWTLQYAMSANTGSTVTANTAGPIGSAPAIVDTSLLTTGTHVTIGVGSSFADGTDTVSIQTCTLPASSDGGKFAIAFDVSHHTADVDFNILAADLQTAVNNALTGTGFTVTVTGTAGSGFTLTFDQSGAQATITQYTNTLTKPLSATVVTTQQGGTY